jgi:hypothetical protein
MLPALSGMLPDNCDGNNLTAAEISKLSFAMHEDLPAKCRQKRAECSRSPEAGS